MKSCMFREQVNNGVYKSGFATTQSAYDRAQRDLYSALDMLERRLHDQGFLVGDRFAPCPQASMHTVPTNCQQCRCCVKAGIRADGAQVLLQGDRG